MRLFIAIETPPEIRKLIVRLIAPLRTLNVPVRWEQDEKLHVTLKFIGDKPETEVPGIIASLEATASDTPAPFFVRYTSPGMFPDRRRPKVIWIGMDDPDGMMKKLSELVNRALEPFGIEREQRAFHPHVTVGRIKGKRFPARLLDELEKLTLHTDQVPVSEFVLMKSELKPDGSVYTILGRFPMGRGKPDQPAS